MVIKHENNTKTCILEKVGLTEYWKLIVLAREKKTFYIFSEKYFEKIKNKKCIFRVSSETLKSDVFFESMVGREC